MAYNFRSASYGYLTGTLTFASSTAWSSCAWIRLRAYANFASGLISRTDGVIGHVLANTGDMSYMWEGSSDEYGATTGLTPSMETWYFWGVHVSSSAATVYMGSRGGTLNSWTNTKTHNARAPSAWIVGSDRVLADNSRSIDGDMAEIGMWAATLTAAEMASLHKGYSPLLVRRASLRSYIPCVRGKVDPLGTAWTENQTPGIAAHPAVIYPRKKTVRRYASVAAGGFSTALFRENAGLGGIGGGPFARANAGLGAIA